jgi:general secretion pathway protein J
MGRPVTRRQHAEAGFTLIEVVVAVALMALIVGALATITAQWLPNWKRGLLRAQRNEQVAVTLNRLVADLSAAEYVSANGQTRYPLFRGDEGAVIFVRSAVGPNTKGGLEIVRIAEIADARGPALVRTRAPFILLPSKEAFADPIPFADPVVLLRAPLHIAFAYAGLDGKWKKFWYHLGDLPTEVGFIVRDANAGGRALLATATRIQIDTMAPQPGQTDEPPTDAAKPPPNDASGL